MYVRIARFEGAEGNWEERIDAVREQMAAGKEAADGPPIQRALMLVDRARGRGAALTFCETEDDLREADAFMNNMSRPAGGGSRISVELFEVAVDTDEL
jgi:hypothetical protein